MAQARRTSHDSRTASSPRRRWTPIEGRDALDAWRASGLSMAAFARQHNVPACRLIWWRKRLTDPPSPAPMRFLAVTIRNPETASTGVSSDGTIEILLARGVTLRVPDEFNPRTLARIVETLAPGTTC